jgi:hypothetical protein
MTWFSSLSGNYIGFVDGSYAPSFDIGAAGTNRASVSPGGSASFSLTVSGTWSSPLKVNVSDSESYSSIPDLIHITPSVSAIPAESSPFKLGVGIAVAQSLEPENCTVAVTVADAGVQQTAYLFLTVG